MNPTGALAETDLLGRCRPEERRRGIGTREAALRITGSQPASRVLSDDWKCSLGGRVPSRLPGGKVRKVHGLYFPLSLGDTLHPPKHFCHRL